MTAAGVEVLTAYEADLEQALKRLLFWQDAVSVFAPELGGFQTACMEAQAVLTKGRRALAAQVAPGGKGE